VSTLLCLEAMYAPESTTEALALALKSVWRSRGAADAAVAAYNTLHSGGWPAKCAAELMLTAVTSYHARRSTSALRQAIRVAACMCLQRCPERAPMMLAIAAMLAPHVYQSTHVAKSHLEHLQYQEEQLEQEHATGCSNQWRPIVMACATVASLQEVPGAVAFLRKKNASHDAVCNRWVGAAHETSILPAKNDNVLIPSECT
jgi:hypothetical protein